MKVAFVLILSFCYFFNGYAQRVIPLYKETIPNSIPYDMKEITLNRNGAFAGYQSISKPTLEIYLPSIVNSKSAAVIICPGGGYAMVNYELEGSNIAKAFIKQGTAALILKYRLPSDSIMNNRSIGPLQDAQQAIKLVRQRAAEWNIDVNKVGIMGFSAGGHLAATAGTHFDTSFIPNNENISLRPDFTILVYPVISMLDKIAHLGSRTNLLGADATLEKIKLFSNELHVTDKTPPTWITHTGDDRIVDVDNSIVFYEALRHNKVPVEMHLYPKGDHGFVLNLPTESWMYPLFGWMKANNWIQQ